MSGQRCFVALELQPHIVTALLDAGSALRGTDPNWRDEKWVAEDNLHVTLKFMGTVAKERIPSLVDALGAAVTARPAFRLRLAGARAVPSSGRCSMIWATFDDAENRACEALAGSVAAVAAQFGVASENRRFTPHVTLVRARRPRRIEPDALARADVALTSDDTSMSVPSATLFTSTLTRQGPVYERLARWDLCVA